VASKRVLVYLPVKGWAMILYGTLAFFITPFILRIFLQIFSALGISRVESVMISISITLLSYALSPVNLVIKETKREVYEYSITSDYIFGIPIPSINVNLHRSIIAINVGGALIPIFITLLVITKLNPNALLLFFIIFSLITILSKTFSRVIPGIGVVMAAIIPAFFSSFLTFSMSLIINVNPIILPAVAYSAGVCGTLVGADLLNLKKILSYSPKIISIGGMGVFDGIFMTGISSAALAYIMINLVRF